jgi:hypothetical protein
MAFKRTKSACCLLVLLAQGLGMSVPSVASAEANAAAVPLEVAARPRTEQDLVVRGIYVQQLTAQNPKKLGNLIDGALKAGINTFVVDVWGKNAKYTKAIETIREAGLNYVPRVTMFPDGAKGDYQLTDRRLLEQRWSMIDYALTLGAKDVQLDYIRFSSKNVDSPDNSRKILEVLRFFRERIEQRGARLQIDVFGETAYGPSTRIGQDVPRFAPTLHAVCPMVYPSHWEPHEQTTKDPYGTVHGALVALERQIQENPIPVYAYIEPFNYHHQRMSFEERSAYLEAQLKAVLDSRAQGFYVWSAGNYYDVLFSVLQRRALERNKDPQAQKQAPVARND